MEQKEKKKHEPSTNPQKTLFPLFLVLQATRSFICVLLVITVTVCLAATLMEVVDPGRVHCILIEFFQELAARVTACHVPPVQTVTAQV